MAADLLPPDYPAFLDTLKVCIQGAQTRAALAVNRELILLYWQIGHDILEQQRREGWGSKVVSRLAADLRRAFPEMKGFSRTNLLYMRAFAEAYPDEPIVQQLAGQLPWFHNCLLLDKVKDPDERQWYARAAIQHGWSRAVLAAQIETRLHLRQGAAQTNFERTLPAPASDLAQQLLKDPYTFDTGSRVASRAASFCLSNREHRIPRSLARDRRSWPLIACNTVMVSARRCWRTERVMGSERPCDLQTGLWPRIT